MWRLFFAQKLRICSDGDDADNGGRSRLARLRFRQRRDVLRRLLLRGRDVSPWHLLLNLPTSLLSHISGMLVELSSAQLVCVTQTICNSLRCFQSMLFGSGFCGGVMWWSSFAAQGRRLVCWSRARWDFNDRVYAFWSVWIFGFCEVVSLGLGWFAFDRFNSLMRLSTDVRACISKFCFFVLVSVFGRESPILCE